MSIERSNVFPGGKSPANQQQPTSSQKKSHGRKWKAEQRQEIKGKLFDKMTTVSTRTKFMNTQEEGKFLVKKHSKYHFQVCCAREKGIEVFNVHIKSDGLQIEQESNTYESLDEILQAKELKESGLITKGEITEEERILDRTIKDLEGKEP